MGRLPGTDGARGVASADLTYELAVDVDRTAAMMLSKGGRRRLRILIDKDTRTSSDMPGGVLAAGLRDIGANMVHLGVAPTPTVAYLTKKYRADVGVITPASYSPCEFNGIKIFNSAGYELLDAFEE